MSEREGKVGAIKLEPIFVERIWGGTWLRDEFGFDLPSSRIGEGWAISAHKSGDCRISLGKYKGLSLSQIYDRRRDLFANDSRAAFPLIVKLIDAKDDLSIQVHPDDGYAREHENQSGKSEAWVILRAGANAKIQIGHNAATTADLRQMVSEGKWQRLLNFRPLAEGEVIDIPSGTIHAICAGTSLIEIQQASDLTYRLYDYDRVDDHGKKRELHIQKALDVIDVPQRAKSISLMPKKPSKNVASLLLATPNFDIYILDVEGHYRFDNPHRNYYLATILEGRGKIGRIAVAKGDSLVITSAFASTQMRGDMRIIYSDPKVRN